MTPVDVALAAVLADLDPVTETEVLGLRDLAGRIAAEDILALRTQPGFDASAMDGYAVRACDTVSPNRLRVVGEAAAGRGFSGDVGPGECVRIFTGAPLPGGTDAVVLQEDVVRSDAEIILGDSVTTGRHVRPQGNDFRAGHVLVRKGSSLRAASIALIASGGHAKAAVLRRPRVGVLATGDELVLPGRDVGPHQIVASNVYGIATLAEQAGAEVVDLGIAGDAPDLLRQALTDALRRSFDVLVTVGGASVGDHDLVAPTLRDLGVTLDFMKVAMRPGKPLMAGRIGATRVLGLPGNPASSLVTAAVFLVPMVARLCGRQSDWAPRNGILARDLPANDHRTEFMRARARPDAEGISIDPLARQDSSLLTIFAEADVLLIRPANAGPARAGDPCEFLPFS